MPHIVIVTFAPHGTLGDASSTIKLIREICRSADADWMPHITWILSIDEIEKNYFLYANFIRIAEQLDVKVITNVRFIDYDNHITALKALPVKPDLLILFSSFFQLWHLRNYGATANITTLFAPEYDSSLCYGHNVLATGLRENTVGLFIEPNTTVEELTALDRNDLRVAEYLGICNNTSMISAASLARYAEQANLFVAYFNQDPRAFNKQVNFENFVVIALHLSLQKPCKHVDFVSNKFDPQKLIAILNDQPELKKHFKQISFCSAAGQTTFPLQDDDSLPEIRVANFFPLTPGFFSFLIGIAQPFLAVTGNETFTEGIAANGLLFYQMMSWRKTLATALQKRCEQYLGAEAILTEYYGLILNDTGAVIATETLVNFISANIRTLLEQSSVLSAELNQHHNLNHALGLTLKQLTQQPKRMPELFPSCLEDHGFTPRYVFEYVAVHYPTVRIVSPYGRKEKDMIQLAPEVANKILKYASELDSAAENLLFEISREIVSGMEGYYCFQPPFSDWDDMNADACAVYVKKAIVDQKLYELAPRCNSPQQPPRPF